MFYLQGKPDTGGNSTFASIRLFYLRCLSTIMEIEQSMTEAALFRRT